LKILWDEYVTGKGSKLIDAIKKVKNPDQYPPAPYEIREANVLLCPSGDDPECPIATQADLDAVAGQWFEHSITMEPPELNCDDCVDHVLHFSVRYVQ
jgi:hypothetical protein